jgi:signal transduction histidine kinase/putative methionine-R-sulfoxide reductase with GAF domain
MMQARLSGPSSTDAEARLLDALASLNEIGGAINRIGSGDPASPTLSTAEGVEATLRLIAESAIKVVPGSSAVIYTYNPAQHSFDPISRVSAGEQTAPVPGDEPRPQGMGMRAITQRRRVISYEEADLDIHPIKVEAGARTVACFPLVVAEQTVGILYIYLREDRRFNQLELLMLENFVNQAAMAIFHARRLFSIQRDLARKEDELNHLRRAGLLISSRLRLEETLEAILQMALEVTNAQYGIFRLVDKGGQHLITRAIAGEHLDRPLVETLAIDTSSIMGWVAKYRQPICIPDLRAEPWSRIYYPLDAALEMRSELAVPLIGADGRLEGVLNLESPTVGTFGEQDSHLLQALATQAVIAIQEVRLLDALQEVAQLVLAQPCEHVLNRLVELARDLLNASASAIWTIKDDQLILQVASSGYQPGQAIALHDNPIGQAIVSRSPITVAELHLGSLSGQPDAGGAGGPSQALIVPLLASHDREPVGAISVYTTASDPGRFTESDWDKKVLTCLAHYAALAIHNAARQEALRAAQEQRAVAETFAAVGDIAANLLHQLNNKMGTIPVRVQGIQDKCQPGVLADPYLSSNLVEIERSAFEAMETVRDNLFHLRPIDLAPVDVDACVKAAISSAKLSPHIDVQMIDLEDLPTVMAGQRSLTLVFINLLENATDAMPAEGIVAIRGEACNEWVEITVTDSGPGIAPELHDRIFEFDFSGRRLGRSGKLGFGLWWVKTLIVRLGGSVSVESDGHRGTTFRLRLPRAQEDSD